MPFAAALDDLRYDTANGMICCNFTHEDTMKLLGIELRYRERYDLLQLNNSNEKFCTKCGYDTANGMICCNLEVIDTHSEYDRELRYRERYDLLQQE